MIKAICKKCMPSLKDNDGSAAFWAEQDDRRWDMHGLLYCPRIFQKLKKALGKYPEPSQSLFVQVNEQAPAECSFQLEHEVLAQETHS